MATLEDVSPSGQAVPLTAGALLGSMRQTDRAHSWYTPQRRFVLPYHPYTQRSASPVPTGQVVRYDIEVFPTDAELAAGHRLRLTLTTADVPHLLPSANQSLSLAGGVYEILRDRGHPSYLEVPMIGARGLG